MKKNILPNETLKNRVEYLKDTCVRSEELTYSRHLEQEELDKEKHEYSQNAIKLGSADRQLKEARASHKKTVDPLKKDMAEQLAKIKTGVEEVTEPVYLMDDQEEMTMGYYNGKGQLVYQRPLLQSERQLRIVGNEMTGTEA